MLPWARSLEHPAPRPPDTLCPGWDLWSAEQPPASAVLRQVIRRRLGQVNRQQSGAKQQIGQKNVEFSDLVNYSDLRMCIYHFQHCTPSSISSAHLMSKHIKQS